MKEFIADIPIYLGAPFKYIHMLFVSFSAGLHKGMNTKTGQKIKEYEKHFKEAQRLIKGMTATQSPPRAQQNTSTRLADIVRGSNNDKSGNTIH